MASCAETSRNTLDNKISYIPIISSKGAPLLLAVEAMLNDSISGYFTIDTGMPPTGVILDSTFFYDNFDTTKLKFKFSDNNGYSYYEGEIPITIGNVKFEGRSIAVRDFKSKIHPEYPYVGLLGVDPFLDRYTIIDMDNSRIAFVDSIEIDSSYISLPMHTTELDPPDFNRKYISVKGFMDNKGSEKEGLFVFDTGCQPLGLIIKPSFLEDVPMNNTRIEQNRLVQDIDSLQLGTIKINRVSVGKPLHPAEVARFEKTTLLFGDGVIGMPLIIRFNIIMDYKHNRIYLKPSKYFDVDLKELYR